MKLEAIIVPRRTRPPAFTFCSELHTYTPQTGCLTANRFFSTPGPSAGPDRMLASRLARPIARPIFLSMVAQRRFILVGGSSSSGGGGSGWSGGTGWRSHLWSSAAMAATSATMSNALCASQEEVKEEQEKADFFIDTIVPLGQQLSMGSCMVRRSRHFWPRIRRIDKIPAGAARPQLSSGPHCPHILRQAVQCFLTHLTVSHRLLPLGRDTPADTPYASSASSLPFRYCSPSTTFPAPPCDCLTRCQQVGVVFMALQGASYAGYVDVNWKKTTTDLKSVQAPPPHSSTQP
jgi:hypothetical protein